MSSKACLLLLVVLVQLGMPGHARAQAGKSRAEAEKYIIESSRDWAESVVTGDMSRRRVYFADDFIGTDKKGRRYSKADITRETGPARYTLSNRLESVEVRFFGDTAIAHGSEVWEKRDGSKGRWVWTDTWVLRDGSWQIVAAQDAEAPIDDK
jgi:ketosteroid isomerase-like protein